MGKVARLPTTAASDNCHIRKIRESYFLTQLEFAKLIGVDRRTVIRLEKSTDSRSFDTTAKLLILQAVMKVDGVTNLVRLLVKVGMAYHAMSIAFQVSVALDL